MTERVPRRRRSAAVGVLALLAASAAIAFAGAPPSAQSSDGARLGPTHPDASVRFTLALRLPGHEEMRRRLDRLNGPTRMGDHRFIGPAQFGRRYGIDRRALGELGRRLRTRGVDVVRALPQRTELEVRARAGTVDRVFGSRLIDYRDALGRAYHAPATRPTVPPPMRASVASVIGLDTKLPPRTPVQLVPAGGLTPNQAADAYGTSALQTLGVSGQGQTIAIISFAPFRRADVDAYDHRFGLPPADVEVVGHTNDDAGREGVSEADLDVEIAHAIAPEAHILFYEAPLHGLPRIAGPLGKIVRDGRADIASISWGACEPGYLQLDGLGAIRADERAIDAAQSAGVSVFAASGDAGAYDCQHAFPKSPPHLAVEWPGSSPGLISVGGTHLELNRDGSYQGESAWGSSLSRAGGGGGLSGIWRRPSWQQGPGVVRAESNGNRQLPDVAADADVGSGWQIVAGGKLLQVGGTSASAPFWAASMALVQQWAEGHGAGRIGFAGPMLYSVAADGGTTTPFTTCSRGRIASTAPAPDGTSPPGSARRRSASSRSAPFSTSVGGRVPPTGPLNRLRPPFRQGALACIGVGLALALAGCGSGAGSGGSSSSTAGATVDTDQSASVLNKQTLAKARKKFDAIDQKVEPATRADLLTQPGQITPANMAQFLSNVLQDVSDYWAKTLPGSRFVVNHVWVGPGDSVRTGCHDPSGQAAEAGQKAAFYCPPDHTVYFSQTYAVAIWNGVTDDLPGEARGAGKAIGDFGVAYALAHEYAHAVQNQVGLYDAHLSTEHYELDADCLAGTWANSAYYQGLLEGGDVDEAISTAEAVGDFDLTNPDHHGTPAQREAAFKLGYNTGDPSRCGKAYLQP